MNTQAALEWLRDADEAHQERKDERLTRQKRRREKLSR